MPRLIYPSKEYPVPIYQTIPDYLEGLAQSYGENLALTWFTRKQKEEGLTFRQMAGQSKALGQALLGRGLTGAHVAVVGENCAEWLLAFYAAASVGKSVNVDIEHSDENLREMLRRADCSVAMVTSTYLPACRPLLEEGVLKLIVLFSGEAKGEGVELLSTLLDEGERLIESGAARPFSVKGDDTAAIVFTSGTTSQSKMVMLSHGAMLQNAADAGVYVDLQKKIFTSLPLYHTYGLTCGVLTSLLQGARLYINGDLRTMMRDLHLAKPDTMFTVPLLVEAVCNQMWLAAEKEGKTAALRMLMKVAGLFYRMGLRYRSKTLSGLREKMLSTTSLIICGGAHLGKELSEEMESLGITVLQGYGITEYSPLMSVSSNRARKMGSVGMPLITCQVKLVEEEIWVKGPSLMQGYYKEAEETARVMEDGWFKTGDLGYLDEDGFLYLTGRKKNLVVFKNGKKISPEKLEELIQPIPIVKEVLVSGVANGTTADDVKLTASIYPDPEWTGDMSSYEILAQLQKEIDAINQTLPSYQQIQMINIRTDEFEKTGTKKIKRNRKNQGE